MKLLLVDDENLVLRAITRAIKSNEPDWEVETAHDGIEALELIKNGDFDCMVTDMLMPRMDGVELLSKARTNKPEMIRIVLSGQADNSIAFKAVQPMHRYLAKPCDATNLISTIENSTTTVRLIMDPALKQALGGLSSMPTLPRLYQEICAVIDDPNGKVEDIKDIVEKDPIITAKLLQVVNSALFAFSRRINSLEQAISLLGFSLIRSLVLTAEIINDRLQPIQGLSADSLFTHSFQVGLIARVIGRYEKFNPDELEAAFTAALLHDLGKVVLLDRLPKKLEAAIELSQTERISIIDAERSIIGCDHAAVGGALLQMWGLPQETLEAVALHHSPALLTPGDELSLTNITFAANAIAKKIEFSVYKATMVERHGELPASNLISKFREWQKACARVEG